MAWNTIFLFVCAAVLAHGTLEADAGVREKFRTLFSKPKECKKWPFPSHAQLLNVVTVFDMNVEPSTAVKFHEEKQYLDAFGHHIFLYDEKKELWHMEPRDESEILDGCVMHAWKVSESFGYRDGVERPTPFAAKLLDINDAEEERGVLYTNEVEALHALNRLEAHTILNHPWPTDPWPADPTDFKIVRCNIPKPGDFEVTDHRCTEGATAAIVYKIAPGVPLSNFSKRERKAILPVLTTTVRDTNRKLNIALRRITADNMIINKLQGEPAGNGLPTTLYQIAPADLSMAVNLTRVSREQAKTLSVQDLVQVQELINAHNEL